MNNRLNVFFVGPSRAGKTQLINCLLDSSFNPDSLETIGIDYLTREACQYWDLSGSERFHYMTKPYLRKASEIILALPYCDKNIEERLAEARFWIQCIVEVNRSAHVCLCITKKDLRDEPLPKIEDKDIHDLIAQAQQQGIDIVATPLYTSAKDGQIHDLVNFLKERYSLLQQKQPIERSEPGLSFSPVDSMPEYLRILFPHKYTQIWERAGTNVTDVEAQKIAKIKALLANYTMGIGKHGYFGFFNRVAHGHINRHYCKPVYKILRTRFDSAEEIMEELSKINIRNPCGSLQTRINFIKTQLPELAFNTNNKLTANI